jgi:hypothetical protein
MAGGGGEGDECEHGTHGETADHDAPLMRVHAAAQTRSMIEAGTRQQSEAICSSCSARSDVPKYSSGVRPLGGVFDSVMLRFFLRCRTLRPGPVTTSTSVQAGSD